MSITWIPVARFNSTRHTENIYTVSRRADTGELGCNCPGWRFSLRGKPAGTKRGCRHTRYVEGHPEAVAAINQLGQPTMANDGGKKLLHVKPAVPLLAISKADRIRQAICDAGIGGVSDATLARIIRAIEPLIGAAPEPQANHQAALAGGRLITLED